DRHVAGTLTEDTISDQMRAVAREVPVITRRDERGCQELAGAAGGQKIAQDLVVAGLGKTRVDRPRAVIAHVRVDVLEELQILADDEQVERLRVNDLEFLHDVAGAGAQESEEERDLLARPHLRRFSSKDELEVARVVRLGLNQGHAADGAGARGW